MAPPDKIHPSQPAFDNNHQYCNGRLAVYVQPERDAISVKSLNTESPTLVFMDENREEIADWLLSDRYLLYCTTTSSTIFAINLASDPEEPASKITLPNNHFRIKSALGNRVAISTRSEGFVVWHIGRSLRALDTSETTRRYPNHTSLVSGIFFHPIKPEYCIVVQQFDPLPHPEFQDAIQKHFIVVSYYSDYKLAKVKVGEGINQKEKEQIYQFTLYSKNADTPRAQMQSLHDGNIGLSNIDNFLLQHNHQPWFPAICNPGEKRPGIFNIPYRELRLFLKFDIHRAEFEVQFFQYPALWMTTPSLRSLSFTTAECDEQVFFWRDQALVPFYEAHWNGNLSNIGNAPPKIDAMLLTALDAESPWTNTNRNIPWYYCKSSGQQPTNNHWKRLADRNDSISHVAYKWIGDADFAKEAAQSVERDREWPFNYMRKILGDDNFVILTGAYGFVVWCFNERVTLPHVDSLESKQAEYLQHWKKMPHPLENNPDHLEDVE